MFFDRDLKGADLPPKTLCLTYDDGPGVGTEAIGHYLAAEGIAATFFVVGQHAEEQPEVLARLSACGHRLGNHTYSHPGLVALTEAGGDVVGEIARTDALLRPHLREPFILLRAPYGNWRQKRSGTEVDLDRSIVAELLNRSERFPAYIGPVNWDISAADYEFWERGAPAAECAAAYLDEIRAVGRGIVLMHDSSDDPAARPRNQALETTRRVVPALKAEGYRFVGLDEVPQVRTAIRAWQRGRRSLRGAIESVSRARAP